ncbi:MAG: glycosyltransferase family 4 protein [Chlamydiales bacterium]|nr:glycosyltransferase family 4 protein [Chlamydiales bacterium]
MRIAIVKQNLSARGGLEKQTRRLFDALKERGCQVTLLPKVDNPSGFDVILGIDRTLSQTHHRAGNGVHAAYLKHRNRPLSSLMPRHRQLLCFEKAMLASTSLRHIITNSDMVKQEFVKLYNYDPEKITTIHNGVEWGEMQPAFESAVKDETLHFLFVGQDFRRKGLKPLLLALAQRKSLSWQLTVIGHDRHLPYYQKLAKRYGIEKRITFTGHTDALPYYQRAHALILPTLYDPFANVTVEALAMGLPVITTPTNGGSEIINATNGIVSTDLHAALDQFLQTRWDRNAIRNSVQHLDFANQLNAYAEVLIAT